MVYQPQYLLFCDSSLSKPLSSDGNCEPLIGHGQWHFILERLDGSERLEAMDEEQNIHRDRIALLSVVRGIEALESPGHVKLMTTSRYVDRGMRFGLPNWRDANYHWESFGTLKPIRNSDLWQRVSTAMQFHEITCRMLSASSELAESLIIRHKKKSGRSVRELHLDTTLPSKSQNAPEDYFGHSQPRCQQLANGLNRWSIPGKHQWWDMASKWIENSRYSAALAR